MNNTYIKGRILKGEFVSELFKQRVESIGGTYEANDCLVNSLNSLTDREFKDAKAILTPNGYLVDKLPAIKPNSGGDATIVRNVSKTRVNSSGLIESLPANVLAPDYLNGVCPALNIEGQATNLLQYSEQIDNAYWSKSRAVVTPNTINSPDGTLTADSVNQQAGQTSPGSFFKSGNSFIIGNTYTISVFAKKNGKDFIGIAENFNFTYFNINLGTTGQTHANHTTKIKSFDNGWYRCSITFVASVSSANINFYIFDTNGSFTNLDNGTGCYFWGTQFEESTKATSYIPATNAQVTRSADTVTVPIPAGVTEIIEKYEDGTTNTITTIPASPYTLPVGRYEYILMR